MPRTREELELAAAQAERWLDELDPAVLADPAARADNLQEVAAALGELAAAERHLAAAVAAAREGGRSWGTIGMVLGISKQAARSRFGEPDSQKAATVIGAAMGTAVGTLVAITSKERPVVDAVEGAAPSADVVEAGPPRSRRSRKEAPARQKKSGAARVTKAPGARVPSNRQATSSGEG